MAKAGVGTATGQVYQMVIYQMFGQVYQMTTNFEKFVEFNGVLQEWKVLRDEKDAEQVKSQFVIF